MEKWYKKSYFRNLVDMHIPSGEENLENFDAEKYAECMEISGVDTAYVYASNCLGLCLYPTEIGYRHSITYKRDIFGETLAALRKRGIRVIGYLNSWCTEGARRHPEWQITDSRGVHSGDTERFGTCCLNSPYRNLFHSLVYEMISKYDVEGLWVDMVGFFSPDCTCHYCRERYKKETGRDLPDTINWSDPNYVGYVKYKFDVVCEYSREIVNMAHSARPDITVALQCGGWDACHFVGIGNEYFSLMDYVSGDFYCDRDRTDVVCRLLHNLSENTPFEYMISRAPNLTYHTAIKDKSEILLQAYNAFLCGGSFLFIDAIDPDGGLNVALYEMMGEVKRELEPFFKTVDHDAEVLRDVAIYINFDSFTSRESEGKPCFNSGDDRSVPERLDLLNKALSRAHIDYDIITPKNLNSLSKYKLIIVSDLYRMSESECDKLREYVREGGRAYVSGYSSALSTDGSVRDKFMLEDVIGASYVEYVDRYPVYISPNNKGQKYFDKFNDTYPAMSSTPVSVVRVNSDSAQVLATITYPFTDARNFHRYSSAISNPPSEKTDLPALVYNRFGKGACLYSVAPFEQSPAVCNYDIFASILKGLLDEVGGITLECDECECLEHVLRHNPDKRHYTLSLLNYQSYKKIIPMNDVELSLRLDIEPKKVYTNLNTEIKWEKRDGKICLNLAKLDIYDVIYIEY